MSGKHRKNADQPMRSANQPAASSAVASQTKALQSMAPRSAHRSKTASIFTSTSIALAFAGFTTAVIVASSDNTAAPQEQTAQTVPAAAEVPTPQALQQHGVITAVTADSITARSADGFVQTYRVTPNTTAVTLEGGDSFTAATPFSVNDEVAIQATVTSGTATATAVADRAVIGLDGPPMDAQ